MSWLTAPPQSLGSSTTPPLNPVTCQCQPCQTWGYHCHGDVQGLHPLDMRVMTEWLQPAEIHASHSRPDHDNHLLHLTLCAANPNMCALQLYRCGWNLSGGRAWDSSGCRSYYMAEWTVFSYLIRAGVGAAGAATGLSNLDAFSCPGSLAARALACNTAYRK